MITFIIILTALISLVIGARMGFRVGLECASRHHEEVLITALTFLKSNNVAILIIVKPFKVTA